MLRFFLTGILLVIILHSLVACVTVSSDTRSDKEKARDYVNLGAEYFQYGRLEPALFNLKKAVKYDRSSYAANALLALVYEQLGRYDDAQEHFEDAVDLVAKDSHEYGSIHNNYASFLCARGQLDKAVKYFKRAFEHPLYQTPELALENGGLCYLRYDDLVNAEGYFRQALKRKSNLPRSLRAMAEISYKNQAFLPARAFVQRLFGAQKPGPAELLLAARIERALDNEEGARRHAQALQEQFPDAAEVKMLADLL